MDQNTRLIIINLTCFISFIVFWLVFVMTTIYRYCWSNIQFWFETSHPITPFVLFISLFSTIAIWLLLELFITIRKKGFSFYKLSNYTICSVFLFFMMIVFANFRIYYNIEKGEATPHDLLFKSDYFSRHLNSPMYLEPIEPIQVKLANGKTFPDIPRWRDYLYTQTCEKGIDITGLTQKQKQELWERYQLYIRESYEDAGLNPDEFL